MQNDPTAGMEGVLDSWQGLVDTMARAFDVPAGLIMRLAGDDIEVYVASQAEGNPYKVGDREEFFDSGLYCETVIRRRDMLLVPDALADPDWRENPDIELGMISYLGLPILAPDGEPFGTICVLDKEKNSFSDLYVQLLKQFRSLVENHLRLAVLNHELESKNKELQAALGEVKALKGIIPVCMKCKKVRDDEGFWSRLEAYLEEHQNVSVSHSLCPDCLKNWEDELDEEWERSTENSAEPPALK